MGTRPKVQTSAEEKLAIVMDAANRLTGGFHLRLAACQVLLKS